MVAINTRFEIIIDTLTNFHENRSINNLLSNTHTIVKGNTWQKWRVPSNFCFFPHVKLELNFVNEYINRVVYPIVLAGRDKDKGRDIDDLFYVLSPLLK